MTRVAIASKHKISMPHVHNILIGVRWHKVWLRVNNGVLV